MEEVTIKTLENGPFQIRGPVTIIDAQGNPFEVREGKSVFLCRCGASRNKPFCDSTHSKIGFQAAERAVELADAAR